MDQAARFFSAPKRPASSKTVVFAYFAKILTHDRWTPISSGKVAAEVGISQSCANRAIQALATDGKVERQYGYGRKDACAYRLPKPPEASQTVPVTPSPDQPSDTLAQTIRNMRELERILDDLPVSSASFDLLLKARGDLLRLTAALRAGSVAEAVERLGVLFEIVNPELDEASIQGQMVQSAMKDFQTLARAS